MNTNSATATGASFVIRYPDTSLSAVRISIRKDWAIVKLVSRYRSVHKEMRVDPEQAMQLRRKLQALRGFYGTGAKGLERVELFGPDSPIDTHVRLSGIRFTFKTGAVSMIERAK